MIRRTVLRYGTLAIMFAVLGNGLLAAQEATKERPKKAAPRIELAILLDTSNSMDGLIAQAKTQLWKIVNEFATTTRDGQQPDLYVALFEYGNDGLPAQEGHIRKVLDLTDDLDKVSEELFKLKTNGGSEFCGQVIDVAARTLSWSTSNRDMKCIFIAGNEPFTQGPMNYRDSCKLAANNAITVSTIFCGPHETGISTMWADGAKLADGSYMSIDQDKVVQAIASPQDQQISTLSTELNKTYLAFGDAQTRKKAAERQIAQDANAASAGQAAARAKTKASALYKNTKWDLGDAYRLGNIKLEDLKKEDLPKAMQNMSLKEQKAHIEKTLKQRKQIQEKIQKLSEARDKFVADKRRELAAELSDDTFDAAIIDAVRKQAEQKQYKFKKK